MTANATTRQAGVLQGVTLLLPSGLSIMAIVVLVPSLPLLLAHFKDLPRAEYRVPMLLTIPAACLVFMSPIAGWIADRISRRRVLLVAMILYAFIGMLPLVLNDYWAIFAARVGLGCVEAVVLTVSTTLVGDFFIGPARDRWLGYQIGVASIFATTLAWVGGALSVYGWRGPFAVYASALIMMAAVARFTWEPEQTIAHSSSASDWGDFPSAQMAGFCALTLFGSILFYFVLLQLPILFALHGLPPSATSGFWIAIVGLGITAGTLIFGQLTRLSRAYILSLAFTLLGLGFCGMFLANTLTILILAAAINQIGAGLMMPTLLTWATSSLPQHFRGRGTGFWQGSFSIGQFLMPIIVTFLASEFGGLNGAMRIFAVLAGLAALGSFMSVSIRARRL